MNQKNATDRPSYTDNWLRKHLTAPLDPGTFLVIIGPPLIGKTYLLALSADHLTAQGLAHTKVSSNDSNLLENIQGIPLDHVIIFDDLDAAPEEVLLLLNKRSKSGGNVIASINEVPFQPLPLNNEFTSSDNNESIFEWHADHIHYLPLPPLNEEQIFEILFNDSKKPLDIVTKKAISFLSWGRPGWVRELLHLAELERIQTFPFPRVLPFSSFQYKLPTAQWIEQTAQSFLNPDSIVAALVLSSLEPRSKRTASNIVGLTSINQLIEQMILLPHFENQNHYQVPQIYAAALYHFADKNLLDKQRNKAALNLLMQERVGVPVSDREAIFITNYLRFDDATIAEKNLLPNLISVLERVANIYLEFGEPDEARDSLIQIAAFGVELSDIQKCKAAALLQGINAGIHLLNTVPESSLRNNPDRLSYEKHLLTAKLNANTNVSHVPRSPLIDRPTFKKNLLPLFRWNDNDPLGSDVQDLVTLSRDKSNQITAITAGLLVEFELLKLGLTGFKRKETDLINQLPEIFSVSSTADVDHFNALLLIKTLICVISGNHATGCKPLLKIVNSLPNSYLHERWLLHFIRYAEETVLGNDELAQIEWNQIPPKLPRFLPVRLRRFITDVDKEFKGKNSQTNDFKNQKSSITYQLLRYMSGNLKNFSLNSSNQNSDLINLTNASTLPLVNLATQHFDANSSKNPIRLLQVSQGLQEMELWLVAFQAASSAREIFLQRRSPRNVMKCDELIENIYTKFFNQRYNPEKFQSVNKTSENLTPREKEVAWLIANGLSNKEIAAKLSCSVRTIETHVLQARAKLGAASRYDISAEILSAF